MRFHVQLPATQAALLIFLGSYVCGADQPPPFRPGIDLHRALDSTVGIQWGEVPFRTALANLERGQAFSILLDRRIDPERRVNFTAKDERLEVAMLRLAAQQKLGTAVVGTVIYLGPAETARCLATTAALKRAESAQAVPSAAARLASLKDTDWEALTSPQEVLAETAKAYGVQIMNPERVPHDLWPATHWPPMGFADRMTLILAGFDLSFRFQKGSLRVELVPLEEVTTYTAAHPLRGDAGKAIAAIQKLYPELKPEREGAALRVNAPQEAHEKIDRLLRGEQVRTTKAGPSTKKFSLTVDNQPAGAVAATVAKELGKELKFAPELRPKLEKLVSFKVNNGTLDELLSAALGTTGLKWRVEETALVIVDGE